MEEQVNLNEQVTNLDATGIPANSTVGKVTVETVKKVNNPMGITGPMPSKVVSAGKPVSLKEHLTRISRLAAKSPKAKKARKENWLRMMAVRYPDHPKWGQHNLQDNLDKLGPKFAHKTLGHIVTVFTTTVGTLNK